MIRLSRRLTPAMAALLAALGSAWLAPASAADGVAAPAVAVTAEDRRAAVFAKMLKDPANLDLAFEYAALSAELGDYEAAITALERMLIFAPGLARVQLELGVMYFRLESYLVAEDYFRQATAGANVPAEVKARVQRYLAAIKERTSRHQFNGQLLTGWRFQSNANAGPGSRDVTLNGLVFRLDEQATAQDDTSVYGVLGGQYIYKADAQGLSFEVNGISYGAQYDTKKRLNLGLMEIDAGPRWDLKRFGLPDHSARVYILGNGVWLDQWWFFTTKGGGVSWRYDGESLDLSSRLEWRQEDYLNCCTRRFNSERDGRKIVGSLAASYALTDLFSLVGTVQAIDVNVSARHLDNHELGGDGGFAVAVPSSLWPGAQPWQGSFTVGRSITNFTEGDPILNPKQPRFDHEIRMRLGLTIPLIDSLAALIQLEYANLESNYDTSKFRNRSATAGLSYRF